MTKEELLNKFEELFNLALADHASAKSALATEYYRGQRHAFYAVIKLAEGLE